MKVSTTDNEELKKEDFEKKLGIKIKEWVKPDDESFMKIYTQTGYIVYLRCQDIQDLFNLDSNIFDGDVKFEKDKIVLKSKHEIYRGKAKPLSQIIKKEK